ncbi:MAG: TonB-dependent receptor plug [Rhodobiaceae bacterium]|nr:TonB-dependent receptor plug [Rhodobiaceae bacterium]
MIMRVSRILVKGVYVMTEMNGVSCDAGMRHGRQRQELTLRVSTAALLVAGVVAFSLPARAEGEDTSEKPVEDGSAVGGKALPDEAAVGPTIAPIAVTAARQERSLLETAGNVDVITRSDIQRSGDVTVQNLFRYKAGIEVPLQSSATDPFNSSGGIEIRGVGGNRTQVLVDGNRTLERITDNSRDVVEASNVKAVEIVRGPSSVLWGSDALGGVVNFITRDPSDLLTAEDDWAGDADFSYSSLDNSFVETLTGAARIAPGLELLTSFTRRDASEPELSNARTGADAIQPCPRAAAATQCDSFDPQDTGSNNFLGKLVYAPSGNNLFRLTTEYYTRRTNVSQNSLLGPTANGFGVVTSNTLSYERKQEVERWRVSLEQEWYPDTEYLDELTWKLTYSPQKIERTGERIRQLVPSGHTEQLFPTLNYEETFFEADIQATSAFDIAGAPNVFTYGIDGSHTRTEYERLDVTNNLTLGTTAIARAGGFNFANADTLRADAYIQDEIEFFGGDLTVIPGVRGAYHQIDPDPDANYRVAAGAEPKTLEEFDAQLKLGAILKLGSGWSTYANFGQGFKMPTAQQLFQSIDSTPFFALVPNPNLKPESVDSYEVGVRFDVGQKGYFSVNGFNAKYDDFIQNFVSIDPTRFGLPAGLNTLTYDNVDKVDIWGIEAEGGYQFNESFYTWFNVSHQDGEQTNAGVTSEFLDAIPLKWVQAVGYDNLEHGLNVELVGTFQSGSRRVNNRTTEFAPGGFAVFDLLGRWDVNEAVSVRAGVHNIFDRRYFAAETRGFPINGSASVQSQNPVELQVQPGRYGTVGVSFKF